MTYNRNSKFSNRPFLSQTSLLLMISFLLSNALGAIAEEHFPVKWSESGKERSGRLQLSDQGRSLSLVISDQKPDVLKPGQVLQVDQGQPAPGAPRPEVRESPGRAIAILGFQERLTGQFQSFQVNNAVRWILPGATAALDWPAGSVFAWAFHPSVSVLLFENFERADFPGAVVSPYPNAPDGQRVLPVSAGFKSGGVDQAQSNSESRLIQIAFYEPAAPGVSNSMTLKIESDAQGLRSRSIVLKSSAETSQWSIEMEGKESLARTPISRVAGWHWLSLSIEPDRTRITIDESVLADSRTSWFGGASLTGMEIRGDQNSGIMIDSVGIYQYDTIKAPAQRPLTEDLIQMGGGHEFLGSRDLSELSPFLIRAFLPSISSPSAKWVQGPVVRVTFQSSGTSLWRPNSDAGYLHGLGLLKSPGNGLDCVEGAIGEMNEAQIRLDLSQGGFIRIARSQCLSIEPVLARGLKVIDARPHHLGDETDLKVIPPEPEGGRLAIAFESTDAESKYQTDLAIDVLQALGANISPFVESIKRGELVTEVWLNQVNLGTLNSQIKDRNETPQRITFPILANLLKSGGNQLEFRQKGRINEPDYLDDLSILGVRLYRKD